MENHGETYFISFLVFSYFDLFQLSVIPWKTMERHISLVFLCFHILIFSNYLTNQSQGELHAGQKDKNYSFRTFLTRGMSSGNDWKPGLTSRESSSA